MLHIIISLAVCLVGGLIPALLGWLSYLASPSLAELAWRRGVALDLIRRYGR